MAVKPADRLAAAMALVPRLGPVAVIVLLDLCGSGKTASVAAIARRLGMGRDRVARALACLREAGLVSVVQSRSGGRFAGVVYVVHLPTPAHPLGDAQAPSGDIALPL